MNKLMNYLLGRLGKRTCPIVKVDRVIDCSFNSPWKDYYVIEFDDGTKVELMERPKTK